MTRFYHSSNEIKIIRVACLLFTVDERTLYTRVIVRNRLWAPDVFVYRYTTSAWCVEYIDRRDPRPHALHRLGRAPRLAHRGFVAVVTSQHALVVSEARLFVITEYPRIHLSSPSPPRAYDAPPALRKNGCDSSVSSLFYYIPSTATAD